MWDWWEQPTEGGVRDIPQVVVKTNFSFLPPLLFRLLIAISVISVRRRPKRPPPWIVIFPVIAGITGITP